MSGFFKKTLSFLGFSDGEDAKDHKVETMGKKNLEGKKEMKERDKRGLPRRQEKSSRRKVSLIGSGKIEAKSRVFVTEPDRFEEVQVIADSFKNEIPVVINLQKVDQDLSKRIIDFCGGLTYALEGSIRKVSDKVFLIIPYNVEVNPEESEILIKESLRNPIE